METLYANHAPHQKLARGKPAWIKINDKGWVSITGGKTELAIVNAKIQVSGLKDGESAEIGWQLVHFKSGEKTVVRSTRITMQWTQNGRENDIYIGQIPASDRGTGWHIRLRLVAKANAARAVIDRVQIGGAVF